MKTFITILLFSLTFFIKGQNYSNVYWGNSVPIGGQPSSLMFGTDTLITCSFADGTFAQLIYRSFLRDGTVLDSMAYTWDSTFYGVAIRNNSLARLNSSEFVGIHDKFLFGDTSYTHLVKLNKNLDTIKTVDFRSIQTVSTNSFDILVEYDSAITILGHFVQPNKKLSLYIARFDADLNLQWYTTIDDFKPIANQYYNGYYPYRIRRVGNNYYIAGRCLYTTQSVEGFLVKTDLLGNKIWDKRYKYQNNNGVDVDVVSIGLDSLFTPHYFQSKLTGNIPYGKAYFRIMDTSGVILKDTVYPAEEPYLEMWQAAYESNGIFVVGDFDQGGHKSIVWKLDKNLNTVWRRVYYYGDYEDESWLYNIGHWSDGGIIATGTYFDRYLNPTPKNAYLWLLSLDANGCLDANNCGSDIGFVEWALPGQGIKLYPNPATDFINLELSLPNLQNTTATVRLFNLAGQVVLRQEVQFEGGKARVDLATLVGNIGAYVLELKTETHLFVEKIMIN